MNKVYSLIILTLSLLIGVIDVYLLFTNASILCRSGLTLGIILSVLLILASIFDLLGFYLDDDKHVEVDKEDDNNGTC